MNKYTQDMTGTGDHIEMDAEPERYYDWMLWKLRQSPEWHRAVYGKPSFKDKLKKFLKTNSLPKGVLHFWRGPNRFGCPNRFFSESF